MWKAAEKPEFMKFKADKSAINFSLFFAFEVFSVRQFPFASILIFEQGTFLQAVFVLILLPAVSFQHNQKV